MTQDQMTHDQMTQDQMTHDQMTHNQMTVVINYRLSRIKQILFFNIQQTMFRSPLLVS